MREPPTTGPLVARDGAVLVDAGRCPALHRALRRDAERRRLEREEWARVCEMRRAGDLDAADKLARKILGVQGPPMTEEVKAKLRAHNEAHREEIRERARLRRIARRRTIEMLGAARRRR